MPLFPRVIFSLLGETETAKFAVTTRVTVAVLLACPLVPVEVEKLVATLSVVLPEVVKLEGD